MTTGRINQVAQGHAGRATKRAKPTSPAYDARREPTTQIACSTANTLTKHAHARDADSPMRTCRWCFRRRPAFRKFLRNAKSTSRITPTTAHTANPRRRKHGRPTCAGRFSNNQRRPAATRAANRRGVESSVHSRVVTPLGRGGASAPTGECYIGRRAQPCGEAANTNEHASGSRRHHKPTVRPHKHRGHAQPTQRMGGHGTHTRRKLQAHKEKWMPRG